jgi:hypothetical protein
MVPVEPMSTSASPPPKTVLPGCCSPLSISIGPLRVGGVEPNGPVQRLLAKGGRNQLRATTAMVLSFPTVLTAISGSLFPVSVSNGVLEKLRLPEVVLKRLRDSSISKPRGCRGRRC